MGERSCFEDDPCFTPGCVHCDFAIEGVTEPYDEATDLARERVQRVLRQARVPSNRTAVRTYINAAAGGNLICLDCGSENHTRGHGLCNHPSLSRNSEGSS